MFMAMKLILGDPLGFMNPPFVPTGHLVHGFPFKNATLQSICALFWYVVYEGAAVLNC